MLLLALRGNGSKKIANVTMAIVYVIARLFSLLRWQGLELAKSTSSYGTGRLIEF